MLSIWRRHYPADHWDGVKRARRNSFGAQVMMLENVCYRRDVMAVLVWLVQGLSARSCICRVTSTIWCGSEVQWDADPYGPRIQVKRIFGGSAGGPTTRFTATETLYPTLTAWSRWPTMSTSIGVTASRRSVPFDRRGLHNHIVKTAGRTTRTPK